MKQQRRSGSNDDMMIYFKERATGAGAVLNDPDQWWQLIYGSSGSGSIFMHG